MPQRPHAAVRPQPLATGSPARLAASISDVPRATRISTPEGSKRTTTGARLATAGGIVGADWAIDP